MEFICAEEKQWKEIKTIYMEAFPKRERKPYFALRHSVKTKKAVVMAATEGEQVLGFIVLIPYKDMVMADYLAVSSKVRSRGTGSYIMQNVCRQYKDKKIVLLIERLDDKAENKEQRIARRKFYLKNGFTSSDIFYNGSKRGNGDYEFRRKGFGRSVYRSAEICAWNGDVQIVQDQSGRENAA